MDHMNQDNYSTNSENNENYGKNQSSHTFQGENKKSASHKRSGCGCGCKSAPVDEEVVEIEEDVEY